MPRCNLAVALGSERGRCCGLEIPHTGQTCLPELVCRDCGAGMHPKSMYNLCRACAPNIYPERSMSIPKFITDAVTGATQADLPPPLPVQPVPPLDAPEDIGKLTTEWQAAMVELDKYEEILKEVVARERMLRARIVKATWKPDDEGTKYHPLASGYKLKGVLKVERKVLEEIYPAVEAKLVEIKVDPATIFRTKHALDVTAYKNLTEDVKKIVDPCIDSKAASPKLELVAPGEKE